MTSARIITGAAVQRILVSSAAGLGERCRVLARYTGKINICFYLVWILVLLIDEKIKKSNDLQLQT